MLIQIINFDVVWRVRIRGWLLNDKLAFYELVVLSLFQVILIRHCFLLFILIWLIQLINIVADECSDKKSVGHRRLIPLIPSWQESREEVTLLLLFLNLLLSTGLTNGFDKHFVVLLSAQYEQVAIRKLLTIFPQSALEYNLLGTHLSGALLVTLGVNYEVNIKVAHLVVYLLLFEHLLHLLLLVLFLSRT